MIPGIQINNEDMVVNGRPTRVQYRDIPLVIQKKDPFDGAVMRENLLRDLVFLVQRGSFSHRVNAQQSGGGSDGQFA